MMTEIITAVATPAICFLALWVFYLHLKIRQIEYDIRPYVTVSVDLSTASTDNDEAKEDAA